MINKKGRIIRNHWKIRTVVLLILYAFMGAFQTIVFADDSAKTSTIVNPINYAFPLVSAMTIVSVGPEPIQSSSAAVIIGSDGVAVIIRLSSRD